MTLTREEKLRCLAVQLHYARLDGADCAETDSGGSKSPARWSPMRALCEFNDLPQHMQDEWISYAERVATFAGLEI